MITKITGKCQYDECKQEALYKVFNKKENKVGLYCDYHEESIKCQNNAEYSICCPNCGCSISVN